MGSVLSKGQLLPAKATSEIKNLVRGTSSLAKMCEAKPISFVGNDVFTFNFDSEASFVGENGVKPNGGGTVGKVTIKPYKVVYGLRASDEFIRGSKEYQLDIMQQFKDGFVAKLARALDIGAMHGINPATSTAATTIIGDNHFDHDVTAITPASGATANDKIEAAIAAVQAANHEVTGIVMSPALKLALAQMKKSDNTPYFPELQWGNSPEAVNGLATHVNSTVAVGNVDDAIVGNFKDMFRWGMASDIMFRIFDTGNPDNSESGDLAALNQVYLRGEAYIGWAVLVPAAFSRIPVGE